MCSVMETADGIAHIAGSRGRASPGSDVREREPDGALPGADDLPAWGGGLAGGG